MGYRGLVKSLLLIFVLAGCTPTSLVIDSSKADYGAYPENYKEIAGQYLTKYFTNSVSFYYEVQEPFKAYSRRVPILGGKIDTYGYLVYVTVIAVYTYYYRSYTTQEEYRLLIRNGKVVERINPNKYYFGEHWYQ